MITFRCSQRMWWFLLTFLPCMEADCPLQLYYRLTARAPPCQWYVTGSSNAKMHLARWPFAWRWVSTKVSFGFISMCRFMIFFGWAYSSFYLFPQLWILRMANHDQVLVPVDLSQNNGVPRPTLIGNTKFLIQCGFFCDMEIFIWYEFFRII